MVEARGDACQGVGSVRPRPQEDLSTTCCSSTATRILGQAQSRKTGASSKAASFEQQRSVRTSLEPFATKSGLLGLRALRYPVTWPPRRNEPARVHAQGVPLETCQMTAALWTSRRGALARSLHQWQISAQGPRARRRVPSGNPSRIRHRHRHWRRSTGTPIVILAAPERSRPIS